MSNLGLKIGQNLKYDCLVLSRYGTRVTPMDDTMLISYALDSGRGGHGMDVLSERHLAHSCMSFKEVIAKYPELRASVRNLTSFRQGAPVDIDFVITGPDLITLADFSNRLRQKAAELPALSYLAGSD